MHILLSLLLTLASLVSTDHDIASVLPVRPESGAQIRLAFGTVAQMTANTRGMLETILTLREGGQTHRYLLSNVTRINGRRVTCFQTDGGPWRSNCSALQLGITLGKTRVAVLYWPLAGSAFVPAGARGTDTLVVLPP